MFEVHVLGSSSKGNCIYVNDGELKFLLDCGLSLKKTKQKLHNIGVTLTSIDYVLVTHEHIDHIRCLRQLVNDYNLKVIASRGTLTNLDLPNNNVIIFKDGTIKKLQNTTIKSKRINHDALEPLCFSIENSMGEKLLYLTDCGLAKYFKFKDYDIYIIEANYSKQQLEINYNNKIIHKVRYARALSGMGHLDIDSTINFLAKNKGENTKKIILSHLSSENADKKEFKNKAIQQLSFNDVYIAQEGLNINCGVESQPF